jgi:hypothetical protein
MIHASLDLDDVAGLRGINSILNRGVARSLSAAGGIGAIDKDEALLLRLSRARAEQYQEGHKA